MDGRSAGMFKHNDCLSFAYEHCLLQFRVIMMSNKYHEGSTVSLHTF